MLKNINSSISLSPNLQVNVKPLGKRIMLVDDDWNTLFALKELLRFDGFSVEAFSNGGKAVCSLTESPFDAIIVDLQVLEMNGLDTVIRLKRIQPKLYPIIITSYGVNTSHMKKTITNAWAFLNKPIDYQALLTILHAI